MKFGVVWRAAALVALGCATLGAILLIERIPSHHLTSLLGFAEVSSTPNTSSESTALGSVAVQTFDGSALVRQGSGVAVSSDGLILTTTAVAPYGSGSFVYQVATERGQLLRARRIVSDPLIGLVLLKVETNDLNAILFDQHESLQAGMELEAISSQLAWSKFSVVRLPVWVVWSDEAHTTTALSLDRAYGNLVSGARLVSKNGYSVGIFRWTGQPMLIRAEQINDFLEKYLNGNYR